MNMFSFKKKQKRVYLDNAGATKLSPVAEKALLETLQTFGNPSGIHKEGAVAGQLLDKARALCAGVLNAHAYEVYFMSSGTESCSAAIIGTYEGYTKNVSKDVTVPHIITTTIEHPSVLEPIIHLEKEGKVSVTYIPVTEEGLIRVKDVEEALREETVLVTVMYANNEIGTILPIKELGRMIEEWKKGKGRTHASYPYFHTDACQAANYENLDVVRLRTHLMTVNSSKVYGPKGAALLYKREGILLEPIFYGGGQERGLRSGTENTPTMYAFGVALDEAKKLREKESARLREIRDKTVSLLKEKVPSIIFYGTFDVYNNDPKLATKQLKEALRLPNNINCRIPGISSEEMILRLDAVGYAVSHKSACASRETEGSYVVMALGATEDEAMENIRISMGRSTTESDMKGLVEAMATIAKKYAK